MNEFFLRGKTIKEGLFFTLFLTFPLMMTRQKGQAYCDFLRRVTHPCVQTKGQLVEKSIVHIILSAV